MPEGSLKPEEVARLDPYKRKAQDSSSKAKELLDDVKEATAYEELSETQRFTKEARKALEKEGYVIYELTGQSIASLREAGNKFWSDWHEKYPDFEAMPSRKSEVAVLPSLFLPDSSNKPLFEQEAMVKKFSRDISSKIPGVKAILGEAPDYIELAFLSPSDNRLFGKKYNYNYTRTQTPVGSRVARVGLFPADNGLHVGYWDPDSRDDYLRAAPLVVPVGNR